MKLSYYFFGIAVVLAGLASFCYYVAVWRLVKRGVSIKFLAMPNDTMRVLNQYRSLAGEERLSLWPIYGFWLLAIPALLAIAVAAFFPPLTNAVAASFPSMSVVLLWVSASSFVIALLFSYRIFRYVSDQKTAPKGWFSDEYVRNDFAIAAIGWSGFLMSLLRLCLMGFRNT